MCTSPGSGRNSAGSATSSPLSEAPATASTPMRASMSSHLSTGEAPRPQTKGQEKSPAPSSSLFRLRRACRGTYPFTEPSQNLHNSRRHRQQSAGFEPRERAVDEMLHRERRRRRNQRDAVCHTDGMDVGDQTRKPLRRSHIGQRARTPPGNPVGPSVADPRGTCIGVDDHLEVDEHRHRVGVATLRRRPRYGSGRESSLFPADLRRAPGLRCRTAWRDRAEDRRDCRR